MSRSTVDTLSLETARLVLRPPRLEDFDGYAASNTASQSVARKLGARNRGPGKLPPPYENAAVDIWGQTRDEWLARRHTVAAAR